MTTINSSRIGFSGHQTLFFQATSADIRYIRLSSSDGSDYNLDNLKFGNKLPAPEPGSLALIGIGAAGYFRLRRRRRVSAGSPISGCIHREARRPRARRLVSFPGVQPCLLFLAWTLILSCPNLAHSCGFTSKPIGHTGGVAIQSWTYPSDGLKVKGLLFLPDSQEKLPLIVFNHDGVSGISAAHQQACARLARAGYAVFAPSYRGEDGSEGNVEVAAGEVRDVLNVLPLLAGQPRIDSRRIAVLGVSHGALISVLAAAREPEVDALVVADGVMDIYGWWSVLKNSGKLGNDPLTRRTYGDGPTDKPQAFASRHALAVVPELKMPVLILQAGRDEIVPPEQARRFKAELDQATIPATLKIYPHSRHAFLVYPPDDDEPGSQAERTEADLAWQDLLAFLEEHLRLGRERSRDSPANR